MGKTRKSTRSDNASVKIGDGIKIGGDSAIGKGAKIEKNVLNPNQVKKSFQDNIFLYILAGIIIIVVAAIIVNSFLHWIQW